MQSIKRKKAGNNFTILSNDFLEDKKLSLKAKGLLAYILSLPDDWKIWFEEIVQHHSDGITAVRNAWKELENEGYAQTVKVMNEETNMVKFWYKEVSDTKTFVKNKSKKTAESLDMTEDSLDTGFLDVEDLDVGFLDVGFLDVGFLDVENLKLLNTNKPNTNKPNTNKINNSSISKKSNDLLLEKEFETLWKNYPNKTGKPKALKSYISARKKKTTFEEVEKGLADYNKYLEIQQKTWDLKARGGAVWFGNQAWADELDLSDTATKSTGGYNKPKAVVKAPEWSEKPAMDNSSNDEIAKFAELQRKMGAERDMAKNNA